jgi:hypothetical protein
MAVPLNVFKTFTAELTTTLDQIYEAPEGVTAIVLMAQVTNVTTSSSKATVVHAGGGIDTELIKDFAIPPNDATSATTGKLILEAGQSVKASAQGDNQLKITLSVLETLNA